MKNILALLTAIILGASLNAASLTGQVYNSVTEVGIPNARVRLWYLDWHHDSTGMHHLDFTDSNGNYEFLDLAEGLYTLLAWSFSGYETYIIEEINITGEMALDIPLNLLSGIGNITGQVYDDASGDPLENIFLKFIPLDTNNVWHSAWTLSDGSYSVGLSEGDYYALCFQSSRDTTSHQDRNWDHDSSYCHFTYFEFFDNVQNMELATSIMVTEGETVSGVDFGLPPEDQNLDPTHFSNILNGYYDQYINFHEQTGLGMINYIIIEAIEPGDIGDEIGILDSYGNPGLGECGDENQGEVLVGAGAYTGESMIIPIYGSVEECEDSNTQYPGFLEGNQIELVLWDASEETETVLNVEFSFGSPTPDAGGTYNPSVFGNQYTFVSIQGAVAIHPISSPKEYIVGKNFPNPFNPVTTIQFTLPGAQNVQISIHDLLGKHVRTLVNDVFPSGIHSVHWDGTNQMGTQVASGVYFYTLQTTNRYLLGKMLLAK